MEIGEWDDAGNIFNYFALAFTQNRGPAFYLRIAIKLLENLRMLFSGLITLISVLLVGLLQYIDVIPEWSVFGYP